MENKKYQDSHITPKELHRIWWQLHDLLESNPEIWLQPTKSKTVADLLKTNQKYFSQVVNQATGLPMISFFHGYRIELFLEKISKGEGQLKTMEGIADEVGFKNRSSFYKAFKKVTGTKPIWFLEGSKEKISNQVITSR